MQGNVHLEQLRLDKVHLAIDLIKSSGCIAIVIVRVGSNLFQLLEEARMRIRCGIGGRIGSGIGLGIGLGTGIGRAIGLRAICLTVADKIANAPLVVVTSSDIVGCLVGSRSACCGTRPVLGPVADDVSCASPGEPAILVSTGQTILCRHAKGFEPL